MIPFYEPLSPNPPLLRWNLNTSQTKEQKRRSDWCEIHTLMRRSDWCEQHTTICTLTQMLFLFKKKKKLKNEAGISTRAFPLESPSKKPAIILKTLTGKLFETRLMSSAQAWSMKKARMCRRNWDRFEATGLPGKLQDKTFTGQHHFVWLLNFTSTETTLSMLSSRTIVRDFP